jgi:hypothetical protein
MELMFLEEAKKEKAELTKYRLFTDYRLLITDH